MVIEVIHMAYASRIHDGLVFDVNAIAESSYSGAKIMVDRVIMLSDEIPDSFGMSTYNAVAHCILMTDDVENVAQDLMIDKTLESVMEAVSSDLGLNVRTFTGSDDPQFYYIGTNIVEQGVKVLSMNKAMFLSESLAATTNVVGPIANNTKAILDFHIPLAVSRQ